MTRELADERLARLALYGERSGTVDVVPARELVVSNHARTVCENGHTVYTVQVGGEGPAFFQRACPTCGGELPDVYPPATAGSCPCGDPYDCNEPRGAHA